MHTISDYVCTQLSSCVKLSLRLGENNLQCKLDVVNIDKELKNRRSGWRCSSSKDRHIFLPAKKKEEEQQQQQQPTSVFYTGKC
jgi:hypothetical protein